MEQVLFVQRELDVFRIPPRAGASGWRSGEWRLADKIFSGRCRVVAVGEALEVRLEDPNTGELFGAAPVPPGQAHIAVEQASDSSRNFVLRLEDAASKRHAFVGVSFAERSAAFDFNVAISDHERQLKRAAEMAQIQSAADPLAAASNLMPEAAALFRNAGDLSLKEGETIKITVKKKEHPAADGESFLARMGQAQAAGSGSTPGRLAPLAPPPGQAAAPPLGTLAPPPAPAAAAPAPGGPAGGGLLGWGQPVASSATPAAAGSSQPAPAAQDGWATFD